MNNMVIGYMDGFAVIVDELDNVFVLECEKGTFPAGTYVEQESVISIDKLDERIKENILNAIEEGVI